MTMTADDSDDDPTSMLRSRVIGGDNGYDPMAKTVLMLVSMVMMAMTQ